MNRIRVLLQEGPQEVNWLLVEAGGFVPPGTAWRHREYHRRRAIMRKGYVPKDVPVTDGAIAVGQRGVVRQALNHLIYRKEAEYFIMDDGRRGIRLVERERGYHESNRRNSAIFWSGLSPAERSLRQRTIQAKRSPEERSESIRRAWKTRKRSGVSSMPKD